MSKVSKKEIRKTVESSLRETLAKLNLTHPSKKTDKLVKRVAKKLAVKVKDSMKKQLKAAQSPKVAAAKA
jgi:transcription initiation factor TFIIIB Brf1 subunit/transcription initiation factor TFIIB